MLIAVFASNTGPLRANCKRQMPSKKQKAIRSTKKDAIYDLMTDLGSSSKKGWTLSEMEKSNLFCV